MEREMINGVVACNSLFYLGNVSMALGGRGEDNPPPPNTSDKIIQKFVNPNARHREQIINLMNSETRGDVVVIDAFIKMNVENQSEEEEEKISEP